MLSCSARANPFFLSSEILSALPAGLKGDSKAAVRLFIAPPPGSHGPDKDRSRE